MAFTKMPTHETEEYHNKGKTKSTEMQTLIYMKPMHNTGTGSAFEPNKS